MDRGTRADQGTNGYFLRMALKHYRNFVCYTPSAKGTRVSNTVEFFPDNYDTPTIAPIDSIALILAELKQALQDYRHTDLFDGKTKVLHQTIYLVAIP